MYRDDKSAYQVNFPREASISVVAAVHFVVSIIGVWLIASKSEMARNRLTRRVFLGLHAAFLEWFLGFVEYTVARNWTLRTPIMEICDWILGDVIIFLVAGLVSLIKAPWVMLKILNAFFLSPWFSLYWVVIRGFRLSVGQVWTRQYVAIIFGLCELSATIYTWGERNGFECICSSCYW